MTKPKSDLRLSARTPAYVSRESGAAELDISPQTWDEWVRAGRLPPPAPGFPAGTRRWRWSDVDDHLSGRRDDVGEPVSVTPFDFAAGLASFPYGKRKDGHRALAA